MPSTRNTTSEVMTNMTAAIAKIRAEYAGALSARGLSSVPPAARPFVKAAQQAVAELESAIATAAARVPAVMADIRVYPEGRRQSAREALGVLDQAVADKAAMAQRALELARTQLRAAALRPVDRKEELTARADAQMMLDRVDPKRRDVVMGELARRQDAIGALVSSQWGRDYMTTYCADPTLVDLMHESVVTAAVDAAAAQQLDEARRDAAAFVEVLPTLHGLRDAMFRTGEMVASSLRDDHGLRAPVESPVGSYPSTADMDALVSDTPL